MFVTTVWWSCGKLPRCQTSGDWESLRREPDSSQGVICRGGSSRPMSLLSSEQKKTKQKTKKQTNKQTKTKTKNRPTKWHRIDTQILFSFDFFFWRFFFFLKLFFLQVFLLCPGASATCLSFWSRPKTKLESQSVWEMKSMSFALLWQCFEDFLWPGNASPIRYGFKWKLLLRTFSKRVLRKKFREQYKVGGLQNQEIKGKYVVYYLGYLAPRLTPLVTMPLEVNPKTEREKKEKKEWSRRTHWKLPSQWRAELMRGKQ